MAENRALRAAVSRAGLRPADVAARMEVDPKTVERWLSSGRRPHRFTRDRLASLVNVSADELWPTSTALEEGNGPAVGRRAIPDEVVAVYTERSAIPDLAWSMVGHASQNVDICAYAALFLHDHGASYTDHLLAAAGRGAQVRVVLSDPDGEQVHRRGADEGIGDGLAARARLSLTYLEPAVGQIDVRVHDEPLYSSTFRFDDELLHNPHLNGIGAKAAPVMHLRVTDAGLAATVLRSFEWVWNRATPWEAGGAK